MRRQQVNWIGSVLLVLVLGGSAWVWGQVTGGTFTGVVKDQSGAVVPGVKILLKGVATGVETNVGTSSEGVFTVPFLPAGDYIVTAEKQGFKKEVFGPVTLQVNQTVRVDFTLVLGQVTQTVEVRASGAQIVQPETGGISQVIVDRQISQMPLNGRNWQQLIALSAGTTAGSPGESGQMNPFNLDGQRSKNNNYYIDGVSTLTDEAHDNCLITPLEGIQEFSIETNSYPAQYGNAAGGVMNLQVRSGTNRWHGSLFEYFRNNKLDANAFFSNANNLPRNPLRYNQFGGSVGGPIRRDKTFVFLTYQGTRSVASSPVVATVPLVQERQGDFSDYKNAQGNLIPIYDPNTPDLPCCVFGWRPQFPNNVMPPSAIDPSAQLLLKAFPPPNRVGANGVVPRWNNWAGTARSVWPDNSFTGRVDQNFSAASHLFAHVITYRLNGSSPATYGPLVGGSLLGAGYAYNDNNNIGVGYTYIIRPTLVNEFRAGENRWHGGLDSFLNGQNTAADQFHIPGININSSTYGLPLFSVTGYWLEGDSLVTPNHVVDTIESFSDTLAWTHGRQTIRVGGEAAWSQMNFNIRVLGKGLYGINANLTSDFLQAFLPGIDAGNAVASFLTGYHSYVVKDDLVSEVGLRTPRYAMFFQDDFKASNRLTLNLGVRYDIMPPLHEAHNHLANFDPATKAMVVASSSNRTLRNTDYRNIQPRLGMALALTNDRKTLLRAGYGINFLNILNSTTDSQNMALNIPNYYRQTEAIWDFFQPVYRLSTGPAPFVIPPASTPDGNVFYQSPTARNGYSQHWTLGIQRAITSTLMVEVAYIGTSGTRLLIPLNINAAGPGTTDPTTRRRISNALATVALQADAANSIYHGMQLKVEKRYAQGLYLLASWTWSKSIDNDSNGIDASAATGTNSQDPYNLAAERGLSSFDRTHRLVVSSIWEVPYGRGKHFGSQANRVLNFVLGGWQASGILTAQSGSPLSILMACADVNAEGDNCRANRVASGILPKSQRTLQRWYDPTAFVKVPTTAPAYGNSGRNVIRSPGGWGIDMGISKYFRWGQDSARRIQFRTEMFNALNHTNWGLPGTSVDAPGAMGVITSAGPNRVIQLALRFEF